MAESPEYYCFDFGTFPDELYKPEAPQQEWEKHLIIAGKDGFKPGQLSTIAPIGMGELIERLIMFPVYMMLNAAPFVMPPALWLTCGLRGCLYFVLGMLGIHGILLATNPLKGPKTGQYVFTQRHTQKYNSIKWVWPKSLHPPAVTGPKLFCLIPHGVAPVGQVAYPGWSRLFGERLCHPTCAKVVLTIPLISYFLKSLGFITAQSGAIKKHLVDKQESVLLDLDGIAGMFQKSNVEEVGFLKSRKGVVKIALTTGTPLVPVFGFGHSRLWRLLLDPWGILEKFSVAIDVSVIAFCGRPFGLLPLGPPFRVPCLLAFGDPIIVPKVEHPTQEQIDEYHAKMLEGFTKAFDKHKIAYGWDHKSLRIV